MELYPKSTKHCKAKTCSISVCGAAALHTNAVIATCAPRCNTFHRSVCTNKPRCFFISPPQLRYFSTIAESFSRNASGFFESFIFFRNEISALPVFNTAPGRRRQAMKSQIKNACVATPNSIKILENVLNSKQDLELLDSISCYRVEAGRCRDIGLVVHSHHAGSTSKYKPCRMKKRCIYKRLSFYYASNDFTFFAFGYKPFFC